MAKWRCSLVVMMVEVDNVRWAGVDILPFWSLVSSSETATSDMPIFWVWAKRNQWLWAHLYPSMLWESRERSIKHQSSWNSLTHSLGPWRSLNWWNGWERGWDSYYEWWLGGVWDLLYGWGMEIEAMERRLCVWCYLWNVLRTSVCQIVENVKKVWKNNHIPFCEKCSWVSKSRLVCCWCSCRRRKSCEKLAI